jgi:hypothetical protein
VVRAPLEALDLHRRRFYSPDADSVLLYLSRAYRHASVVGVLLGRSDETTSWLRDRHPWQALRSKDRPTGPDGSAAFDNDRYVRMRDPSAQAHARLRTSPPISSGTRLGNGIVALDPIDQIGVASIFVHRLSRLAAVMCTDV